MTTTDFNPGTCTCGNPDGGLCEPWCGTPEPVETGRHCCDPGGVYVAIRCARCPLAARHA